MTSVHPAVLVDRIWSRPSERNLAAVRAIVVVVAFALLTAALAQWELKLSFTPVPITGQTLGVLLAGGALGWRSGAASQLLYWMFGLVGLPFYAGGAGGWTNGTGATMGYFVGFVVDAVQHWPAEHKLVGHARFIDDHTLQAAASADPAQAGGKVDMNLNVSHGHPLSPA